MLGLLRGQEHFTGSRGPGAGSLPRPRPLPPLSSFPPWWSPSPVPLCMYFYSLILLSPLPSRAVILHLHTHTHTQTHTSTHTYTHTPLHTHTYTHSYTQTPTYTHLPIHTHAHTHTDSCLEKHNLGVSGPEVPTALDQMHTQPPSEPSVIPFWLFPSEEELGGGGCIRNACHRYVIPKVRGNHLWSFMKTANPQVSS